uniref:Uncharacterized protein n=1 Tax=Pyxicephalus adspersus TaxID=30357 RepID=A0AAV3ASC2_PYXAD|nr:TPA: hypothetical protein GDO54_006438 [Pyxicephalus adspersus]
MEIINILAPLVYYDSLSSDLLLVKANWVFHFHTSICIRKSFVFYAFLQSFQFILQSLEYLQVMTSILKVCGICCSPLPVYWKYLKFRSQKSLKVSLYRAVRQVFSIKENFSQGYNNQ